MERSKVKEEADGADTEEPDKENATTRRKSARLQGKVGVPFWENYEAVIVSKQKFIFFCSSNRYGHCFNNHEKQCL